MAIAKTAKIRKSKAPHTKVSTKAITLAYFRR